MVKTLRKKNTAGGIFLSDFTTSRPCSNHHSEELAGTQTHGLQERIESPGMNPHVCGQFMKNKPETSEEERTVFSRNSDRKTGHLHGGTSVKVIL